jgi:hypothetical protein
MFSRYVSLACMSLLTEFEALAMKVKISCKIINVRTFLFHLQVAALNLPTFFLMCHSPTVTEKQNISLLCLLEVIIRNNKSLVETSTCN